MPTITLKRLRTGGSVLQPIQVSVDGRKSGRLFAGSSIEVPVTPGKHIIRAKSVLTKAREQETDVAESTTFIVRLAYWSLFDGIRIEEHDVSEPTAREVKST
jgi:hypothetical protein